MRTDTVLSTLLLLALAAPAAGAAVRTAPTPADPGHPLLAPRSALGGREAPRRGLVGRAASVDRPGSLSRAGARQRSRASFRPAPLPRPGSLPGTGLRAQPARSQGRPPRDAVQDRAGAGAEGSSAHTEPGDPGTGRGEGDGRLEIRRRSGLAPPDRASMQAWHRRYARAVAPLKDALGELLEERRRQPPRHWTAECERLSREVERFGRTSAEERLFPVADAAADLHLKHLFRELARTADACTGGRWAEVDEHLRRAGLAYGQARLALGRWGVRP